jgi:hypothetical protein
MLFHCLSSKNFSLGAQVRAIPTSSYLNMSQINFMLVYTKSKFKLSAKTFILWKNTGTKKHLAV